jgi:hypothetical protein
VLGLAWLKSALLAIAISGFWSIFYIPGMLSLGEYTRALEATFVLVVLTVVIRGGAYTGDGRSRFPTARVSQGTPAWPLPWGEVIKAQLVLLLCFGMLQQVLRGDGWWLQGWRLFSVLYLSLAIPVLWRVALSLLARIDGQSGGGRTVSRSGQ